MSFSRADRSVAWHPASPLEPLVRHVVASATAMTVLPGTDYVVIGDGTGFVRRVVPDGVTSACPEGACLSTAEGVRALCPSMTGHVIGATPSGKISRLTIETGNDETIRYVRKILYQDSLLPAGRVGVCWSKHTVTGRFDNEPMLTLLTSSGRDKVAFRVAARAASTCDGGAMICFADTKSVQIHRLRGLRFGCLLRREIAASQVAFLQDTGLLGVARSDDHWLEIWRVEKDAPIIAAIELPDDPLCMTANENTVAFGFANGQIVSVRLTRDATTR